jgi:putative ABC transport system permease protein
LVGASLGVAGIVAMGTFGASLNRLVGTPARYGYPGDFTVADVTEPVMDRLLSDPRVASIALVTASSIRLGGRQVPAVSLTERRGSPAWMLLDGSLPRGPDELALGSRLARQLGLSVGREVQVTDTAGRSHRLPVVGVGLWPLFADSGLGLSAALSPEGLERFGLSEPFREAMVDVGGGDPGAVADEYGRELELDPQVLPVEIANVAQLRGFPVPVGAFLAAVGVAALGHAVTVAVRRRARDVAVLRALGLTSRQAAAALAAMAVTTAAIGVAVGTPVGLSVGNLVWKAVARGVGVADDALVPVTLLVLAAPAALLAAVAAGSVGIRRASRLRPAAVLRSE